MPILGKGRQMRLPCGDGDVSSSLHLAEDDGGECRI